MSNLPVKFLEKLPKFFEPSKLDQVLASFANFKPSTFRTNTLKTTTPELLIKLNSLGIEVEAVPGLPDAFMVKNVPQKVLTATDIYNQGLLYVQSLSSMIPPLVLQPHSDEKILDITAAPGSKTTQMANLMNNQGEIIANDTSRVRLYKLEANLKIQGVTNTTITHQRAEQLWQRYPEYFDKTLVDVPCSMEGRFQNDSPKTYQDWSPKKVKELSQRQKFILRSAISCTKPGGVIVYSTCTLSPEENEEVIDWILEKEAGKLEVETIDLPNLPTHPGLTEFGGKHLDLQIQKTVRIYPSATMEGFFVARLRKLHSTLP